MYIDRLDPNDRTPDPERLLRFVMSLTTIVTILVLTLITFADSAYFHSTATLNYVRGLLTSGFASLNHPRDWSLSHVRSPELKFVYLYPSLLLSIVSSQTSSSDT